MSHSLMATYAYINVVHSLPSMSLHVNPPLRNLADLKLGSKYPHFLLKENYCVLLIPQFPLLQGAFCLQKVDASLCSPARPLNPFLHRVRWEELNRITCYIPEPKKIPNRTLSPSSMLWRVLKFIKHPFTEKNSVSPS